MGGTNPDEIRRLLQAGAKVQQIDTLHAKVYIGDDEMLVASANASSNGLGFEGHAQGNWIEAGAIGPVQPRALEWFQKLWSDSRPVTPGDLAAADDAWVRRQRNRPPLANFSMFDADAEILPLLDWYRRSEWIANETVIAQQLGQAYDDNTADRLGESVDIRGPEDAALLKKGRWVLKWKRTKGPADKGKVGCVALEWMQIGPFVKNAYCTHSGAPWIDVMFPAEIRSRFRLMSANPDFERPSWQCWSNKRLTPFGQANTTGPGTRRKGPTFCNSSGALSKIATLPMCERSPPQAWQFR